MPLDSASLRAALASSGVGEPQAPKPDPLSPDAIRAAMVAQQAGALPKPQVDDSQMPPEAVRTQAQTFIQRGMQTGNPDEIEKGRQMLQQAGIPLAGPTVNSQSVQGVANPFARGAGAGGAGRAPDYRAMAEQSLGLTPEFEEAKGRAQNAEENQLRYEQESARQAYQQGQQLVAHQQGMADQAQRFAMENQQRAAVQKQTEGAMMAQIQEAQQSAAKDRIDPDRLWKEKGTGAHIASALGVALGAFGSSLTHSPNYAMQIVDQAIARDIQAQRDAHNIKREGLADMNSLYAQLRQRGFDDQQAALAVQSQSLAAAQAKLQAMAAGAQNQQQLRNAGEMSKILDVRRAQTDMALKQAIGQQAWRLAHPPKSAGAGQATAKVNELEDESAGTDQAAKRILEQGDDVAGYGAGGRVAHWLEDKTGIPLQSTEARQTRLDAQSLAAALMKMQGERVTPEALNQRLENVRSADDLRALAQHYEETKERRLEVRAAGKNPAPKQAAPVVVDEDEEDEK